MIPLSTHLSWELYSFLPSQSLKLAMLSIRLSSSCLNPKKVIGPQSRGFFAVLKVYFTMALCKPVSTKVPLSLKDFSDANSGADPDDKSPPQAHVSILVLILMVLKANLGGQIQH